MKGFDIFLVRNLFKMKILQTKILLHKTSDDTIPQILQNADRLKAAGLHICFRMM